MPDDFQCDFLTRSAKDKTVVLPLAERLRADGLNSNAEGGRQKAEILHSPFFLHPSLCAFDSDWEQLLPLSQPLTLNPQPLGAPLNQERRFIPLRFDDAPNKGSLAQFLSINWRQVDRSEAADATLIGLQFR